MPAGGVDPESTTIADIEQSTSSVRESVLLTPSLLNPVRQQRAFRCGFGRVV